MTFFDVYAPFSGTGKGRTVIPVVVRTTAQVPAALQRLQPVVAVYAANTSQARTYVGQQIFLDHPAPT